MSSAPGARHQGAMVRDISLATTPHTEGTALSLSLPTVIIPGISTDTSVEYMYSMPCVYMTNCVVKVESEKRFVLFFKFQNRIALGKIGKITSDWLID